jgi:dihydroorotase-like cyclic amidohydrolase
MAGNLLVRSVRIRGDDPTDILIQDGIIASIAPNQKCPNGTEIVEGANCLALPDSLKHTRTLATR